MKSPVFIRKALYGRISREEFATFFKLTRVELVEGVIAVVINERMNLNGAILENCWLSRLSRKKIEEIRAKYFILRSFRALDVISVTTEDLPDLVELLVEDFGEGGRLDFTDSSFLAHGL